ncbi:MAG: hypothetical protein J7K23_06090 [Thermoproteales archaeon]|nr:hypothetical protein [Thermoproteales archaeon]
MSGEKLSSKQKEELKKIWNEVSKRMQINFMIVLDFHVYKVKGEHAKKLFIEQPKKFKEAFTIIFGYGVWKLFEKIIIEICAKNNLDHKQVLALFEDPDLPL